MALGYKLMDEDYKPSDGVERRIQRDLQWINGKGIGDDEKQPIFLVDGVKFEDTVSIDMGDMGRAFACIPKERTIHYTDGAILGSCYLPKPLEELTEGELLDLPGEGLPMFLNLDILQRLKELADNQ